MNKEQSKRLYRLLFFISALACGTLAYNPTMELLDETLGHALRQRDSDINRYYERQMYNRILNEQGKKAAIKFQMTPKAATPGEALQAYENLQWALAACTLLITIVALYHFIWRFGTWAFQYVVHGSNETKHTTQPDIDKQPN